MCTLRSQKKAILQLLVLSCILNSPKGDKMEKALLIFTDVSHYHKVNFSQKRRNPPPPMKHQKDLDVVQPGCSAQVPPHPTWKCTGWTDTSKSLVIPHFRSAEINFIINLEAWFNCANFLLGADRFLLTTFPLYVMNHSEASSYLYLLKV